MNRAQKIAWLILIMISVAFLLTAVSVGILYIKFGFPKAAAGLGFLGITGFAGLGPLIFKKEKVTVDCDERDILINRKAVNAGFVTAFLIVGLACMLPFFILGYEKSISVTWLPLIFAVAGLSSISIHSVSILIQYGRGGKEKNHE